MLTRQTTDDAKGLIESRSITYQQPANRQKDGGVKDYPRAEQEDFELLSEALLAAMEKVAGGVGADAWEEGEERRLTINDDENYHQEADEDKKPEKKTNMESKERKRDKRKEKKKKEEEEEEVGIVSVAVGDDIMDDDLFGMVDSSSSSSLAPLIEDRGNFNFAAYIEGEDEGGEDEGGGGGGGGLFD